jgi:hypothetical protein
MLLSLGEVKTALTMATFDTEQELFDRVMRVHNVIFREELESVFHKWLRRLDAYIERAGECVE